MALNKNALIRYKTIDKSLQNRFRKWTLDDLIEACSDALYEYEGKHSNVSKRTVQLDIQNMRSDKLGYNAPIMVYDKKYYTYEDPDFSITDIPITQNDMQILSESVEILKQFKDFSLFSELNGIIQRLEDKVYTEQNQDASVIHIEKNENLKGLKHLDFIYRAISQKMVLKINYQSFKARKSSDLIFHAYILKEYNNRWFVVGKKNKDLQIMTLALDRIIAIDLDLSHDYKKPKFNADNYYKNTIGVTVLRDQDIIDITLKINKANAPYVITKPFHHSQKLVEQLENGSAIISLRVHHNFELERLLLGFGESIEVIKPRRLRNRIKKKLQHAVELYD